MNIKKFFAVVTLLGVCAFLLSGCCSSTVTTTDSGVEKPEQMATAVPTKAPPTVDTFVIINYKQIFSNTTQYIMYDPETMVMYSVLYSSIQFNGPGVGISHSPMYNADGTLRIYNPNVENGGE